MTDKTTMQELANAYRRTGLAHSGVNLPTALNTPMFNKCLQRMAQCARAKQAQINQKPKRYWWNEK